MLNIQGKNVGTASINGKEVGIMMTRGDIILESGNFRTADHKMLRTADKKIFNVKK